MGSRITIAIGEMSPLLNALLDDNDSTLPDLSVYQTPVLEPSRRGEREAERRRELPRVAWREQHAGVHIAGAVVALVAGGKQDQGIPIHLVPLRNCERRRGAPTQQGDVVKAFKNPGDGVADTDLDRLRKECVGGDPGIGAGPTADPVPMWAWRRLRGGRHLAT